MSEVVNRSVKPVVLIIDDEATNRVLVRAYLGPGYDIHEAADGPAGLELLKQRPVDLVLLDVMMPGTSGFDICRIIKQTAREDRYLPVVLLTALGAHDDRMNGLQAGADDFLTKPVDRQELLLRVETFIKLRRQDQHIHRQVQELTQRDAIIRAQLKEVRELDALKDELVSLMVHDLRNPLAGIDAFLAFLEKSVADGEIKEDAQIALQASSRLRETLEDILQVRMLESGTVRLHRELVEVDLLVREAITSVSGSARARRFEFSAEVDLIADLRVSADRKLVRRAVENLLSNALKYSPSGGVVMAGVHAIGGGVQIEVADRGVGIPDELKNTLFRKFGSVEEARGELRRGHGLGLYLVKLVADAHGGRAIVRDREGGGTTFGLLLPRDQPRPD